MKLFILRRIFFAATFSTLLLVALVPSTIGNDGSLSLDLGFASVFDAVGLSLPGVTNADWNLTVANSSTGAPIPSTQSPNGSFSVDGIVTDARVAVDIAEDSYLAVEFWLTNAQSEPLDIHLEVDRILGAVASSSDVMSTLDVELIESGGSPGGTALSLPGVTNAEFWSVSVTDSTGGVVDAGVGLGADINQPGSFQFASGTVMGPACDCPIQADFTATLSAGDSAKLQMFVALVESGDDFPTAPFPLIVPEPHTFSMVFVGLLGIVWATCRVRSAFETSTTRRKS